MSNLFRLGFALAFLSLSFVSAKAEDEKPTSAKPVRIGVVLGKEILSTDLHPELWGNSELRDYWAISDKLIPPLIDKYIQAHKLGATPTEIEAYNERVLGQEKGVKAKIDDGATVMNKDKEFVARFFVDTWKFNRALYEKYGGRIIIKQVGPLVPLDAWRDWLKDEETAGHFKIDDPKWNIALHEYFKPKYHIFCDVPEPFEVAPWDEGAAEKLRKKFAPAPD